MRESLIRILITLFALSSATSVFANNYIMVSPENITKVDCSNNNVINIHVLTTLTNDKKSVIVTPASDGETDFAIRLKGKKCDYKAKVSGNNLEIKGDKTIKILPLDLPPELTGSEETTK
ncbi:MAG: hypothetical protein K6E29_04510 [Cyanobacteria bacterium RUI128]|nr:hypothetical protein [Cyanobacteria bacterium RUI128]